MHLQSIAQCGIIRSEGLTAQALLPFDDLSPLRAAHLPAHLLLAAVLHRVLPKHRGREDQMQALPRAVPCWVPRLDHTSQAVSKRQLRRREALQQDRQCI